MERDLRMLPGDVAEIASYDFTFVGVGERAGPNFNALRGTIQISENDRAVTTLYPEKRTYLASGQVMTEAAIHSNLWRDLYVALGEPIGEDAWAVRIYYKPGIGWLWIGALLLGIGGFIAASDRRYRSKKVGEAEVSE
jgi:cytochrome c-type biogenesis protein CcmF